VSGPLRCPTHCPAPIASGLQLTGAVWWLAVPVGIVGGVWLLAELLDWSAIVVAAIETAATMAALFLVLRAVTAMAVKRRRPMPLPMPWPDVPATVTAWVEEPERQQPQVTVRVIPTPIEQTAPAALPEPSRRVIQGYALPAPVRREVTK
jgi:hypothetical protein